MLKKISYLFIGLALFVLLYPSSSIAEEEYIFVTKWGNSGSGNSQFNLPRGIAVDNAGYVYVADTYNHRIQKFTTNGDYVTQWGKEGSGNGQFNNPRGIIVDNSGYVYVTDAQNHRIQKFTTNGDYVAKWGKKGSENGQFEWPWGIAVDNAGHIYVADSLNHRIQKFTSDGTYLTKWGKEGSGNGQFDHPRGVAVDNGGYLYVTDEKNQRIQTFTFNGNYVAQWGKEGSGDGQFHNPIGIAVDNAGYVYITDKENHRIQKFTSNGTYVTQWGLEGSEDGQFIEPRGIAIDKSGYVYVADTNNHRIQVFRKKQIGLVWEIPLKSGWNLISFPINKCFYQDAIPNQPDCVEKVDIINDLKLSSLAEWFSSVITPSNAWRMIIGSEGAMDRILPPAFHSLKYVSPCSGYWIKIEEGFPNVILSMEVSSFDPDCPIPLKTGWNLVGCPIARGYYDTTDPPINVHVPEGINWRQVSAPVAGQIFNSIIDDCEFIIGEVGAYNPVLPPGFSSLRFIAPGYGYWIKVKKNVDLIYPQ